MTPSQSQDILHRQVGKSKKQIKAEIQEGQELIRNNDRSSKFKTIYKQVLKLDDSLCILYRKRENFHCDSELFERYEAERLKFLQTINADWLPYIHGETNITDQQNQTTQLTSDAEPTAAKSSQSVVVVSQRTVENGSQNKDNNSKASSDKRAKKAEKLAALEKDFASKMRLKKIEFELKRKELEMEMQLFAEEGKNWKTRKKLLTQEHQILMIVQPLVFEVDHHSTGKHRRMKMFPFRSITRINSPTCTIMVSSVRKPGPTTIIPG